jgi:hypothetical protein
VFPLLWSSQWDHLLERVGVFYMSYIKRDITLANYMRRYVGSLNGIVRYIWILLIFNSTNDQARVMFERYCKDRSPLLDHRNRWCGFEQRQATLTEAVWPNYPRVFESYILFCFCFCFVSFWCVFLMLLCFWCHYALDIRILLRFSVLVAVLSFSVFAFLCMGCLSKFFRLDFQRVVRSGFYSTFLYYWSLLWLVFLPFFVLSCF